MLKIGDVTDAQEEGVCVILTLHFGMLKQREGVTKLSNKLLYFSIKSSEYKITSA